ncbi:hypothetical protein WNY58_00935 [Neptuniibacter pectenicola]|uniref:VanZ like family protein n=1 Tax=Neptuniibacter pectenicola TaxID=1806669 RepID=A0ABU9TML0_9GAMM|nr:MAG: hypothetical protein AXW15_08145 [Neptuniibacter sp. Phe_28]
MRIKLINQYKTIIWVIFLCALAGLAYGIFRTTPPQELFQNSDKVGHFAAFCCVSFLGRLALHKVPAIVYWGSWFILAGLLEYLQGEWRPLRHFSIEDAYANATGVVIALVLTYTLHKILLKLAQRSNPD